MGGSINIEQNHAHKIHIKHKEVMKNLLTCYKIFFYICASVLYLVGTYHLILLDFKIAMFVFNATFAFFIQQV